MKAVTRRNIEIQLVYQYIRYERRHNSAFAIEFIRQNYFFDDSSMYIYDILGMDLEKEKADFQLSEQPKSLIFQLVMNNQYLPTDTETI